MRGDESAPVFRLFVLEVDNDAQAVRMKVYQLKSAPAKRFNRTSASYLEGCDILWKQEAGQFRGLRESDNCEAENLAAGMMLSADALWLSKPRLRLNKPGLRLSKPKLSESNEPLENSTQNHYALDRARIFNCYADVPE